MTIVRNLLNRTGGQPNATEDRSWSMGQLGFSGYFPSQTSAGVTVTTRTAIRSAGVAACRRVLVSSILSMPPASFSERDGRLQKNEQERRIVSSPSVRIKRRAWLAQMANSLILDGNMAALVTEWTTAGHPLQAEPVALQNITWEKDSAGLDVGRINGVAHRLFPLGPLVLQQATPFLRAGELLADSPVDLAIESIGTAIAAEKFGAEFFGDGAHPSSVVTSSQRLSQAEARSIKDAVRSSWQGREPAVLGAGLSFEEVEVNPANSQFVDLMRFELEQVARFFGVPPSMIYAAVSGQAVTYVNVGQSDLQFLKHSLQSWVDDIEDMWSCMLPGPQSVALAPSGLLKMDPKGRHELNKTRLESKTITINEIRIAEGEDPFPDEEYDLPGIPGGATPPAVPDEDQDPDTGTGEPDEQDD